MKTIYIILFSLLIATGSFAQAKKKAPVKPAMPCNCAQEVQTAITLALTPAKAQHAKDVKLLNLQKESLLKRGTEINRIQGLLLDARKQAKAENQRANAAEQKYSLAVLLLQQKHCHRALKILNAQP